MRKLFALIALCVSASVYAQQSYPRDITLSWTNPSTYVDGSTIEAGDLASVRVECYRRNDTDPVFTSTVPATGEGLAQSETFTGVIPSPGWYECWSFAIVVDGTESDPSSTAERKFIGKPLPPQNFL